MKLQEKITALLAGLLFSATALATPVSAQTPTAPQTELSFETRRTADGIDYDVYIEHTDYLSTLVFAMDFTSDKKGTIILADNDCFDIAYSEWNNDSNTSVRAYLGRTGQKAGFSSDDKVKVAQISVPLDISAVGEVTATVTNAACAGIVQTDANALKGTVTLPVSTVKYTVRECSILSFEQNNVYVLSAQNRNADIIYAAYDDEGRLINTHKDNVNLKQGKNEISADGAGFDKSKTVSVMIWDGIGSMRPLADKATIYNQNGE